MKKLAAMRATMIIGIMGAMEEEINAIKPLIQEIKQIISGGRVYYTGTIHNTQVVLSSSRCGKVASAITATTLILQFKISHLIFTGVAGAVNPELNIGDIVISDKLYQHDMDARPLFDHHEIPLTQKIFFDANADMIAQAKLSFIPLLNHLTNNLSPQQKQKFTITTPKCVVGTIASGDQFITNNTTTSALLAVRPSTLAVEMEGAAVAQVCHDHNIPFVIIRTISDRANHQADIDFSAFINDIAKFNSEMMISHMLEKF